LKHVGLDHLNKVYGNIDQNIDGHIENLRELLMQPSVSQTGEGISIALACSRTG
jgi:hypothetical protein